MVDLIKRMNQAMHADDRAYYAVPESQELVAQYLFLYSLSGDPQDFDSLVDNDYRRATRVDLHQERQHDQRGHDRQAGARHHRRQLPARRHRGDGRQPPTADRAQRRHRL
jgi:hypothetical protein